MGIDALMSFSRTSSSITTEGGIICASWPSSSERESGDFCRCVGELRRPRQRGPRVCSWSCSSCCCCARSATGPTAATGARIAGSLSVGWPGMRSSPWFLCAGSRAKVALRFSRISEMTVLMSTSLSYSRGNFTSATTAVSWATYNQSGPSRSTSRGPKDPTFSGYGQC